MSSESATSILDLIEQPALRMLLIEALVLKRIGIDDIPIRTKTGESDDILLEDDGSSLEELVKEFARLAAETTTALHEEVERVPQNRPFGWSTTVQRLMLENINLMNEIIEYDDKTTADFYSKIDMKINEK